MSLINNFRFGLRNVIKLSSNNRLTSRTLTTSKLKYQSMNKQEIMNGQEDLINEYLLFVSRYPEHVQNTIKLLEYGTKDLSYIKKLNDEDKNKLYSNIYMICHSVSQSLNIIEQSENK